MAGDKVLKFTPNMKKGIEVMIAHPEYTYEQVAEAVGCSWASVRTWKNHVLFQEELDKRLKEEWADARRMAQAKMMELAEAGDFRAIQYILDSCGYGAVQEININQNVIKVSVDEDE